MGVLSEVGWLVAHVFPNVVASKVGKAGYRVTEGYQLIPTSRFIVVGFVPPLVRGTALEAPSIRMVP